MSVNIKDYFFFTWTPVILRNYSAFSDTSFSNCFFQFSSAVMSDSLRPLDSSTPGLAVHRQLPEFTHVQLSR